MNPSSSSTKTEVQKRTSAVRSTTVFFVMLLPVLLCICPALLCGAFLSAALVSEPLARSMMPSTYPNSQMIGIEKASGSWGYTEFHWYSTSDSVATVDNWYRNNASNLRRTPMGDGGISFDDPTSDSLLAYIVGYLNKADWGSGPSAGLTIYPDLKNPGLTRITIVIAWPSL